MIIPAAMMSSSSEDALGGVVGGGAGGAGTDDKEMVDRQMIDRLALNLDLDLVNIWSTWYSRLSDTEKVHLLERRMRLQKQNTIVIFIDNLLSFFWKNLDFHL